MGTDANQFDQRTTIISRNCPFFPKILTEEIAPNKSIQLQHIWWNYPLFFHLQSHLMYYTYNCMNHPTIIIFTKFSTSFTPSYTHHEKRERNPYLQHLIMCYIAKENAEKYIRWFNRSVHFMCLLHPYK